MDTILAIITLIIITAGDGRYIYLIYSKDVAPAPATWAIFAAATIMSALSFLSDSKKENKSTKEKIVGGVLVLSDAVATNTIFICVLAFTNSPFKFNMFDVYCLLGAIIIGTAWFLTRKHAKSAFITNLLVQALISTGYFPTIYKLASTGKNSESFFLWSLAFFGGMLALYPAYKNNKLLAKIYSYRTMIMVGIVLALIWKVS